MVDKLKSLVQMSEFIAANSTQTYESWTHFLQFSGRFYKYTYDRTNSIYFQRPEATLLPAMKSGTTDAPVYQARLCGYRSY